MRAYNSSDFSLFKAKLRRVVEVEVREMIRITFLHMHPASVLAMHVGNRRFKLGCLDDLDVQSAVHVHEDAKMFPSRSDPGKLGPALHERRER